MKDFLKGMLFSVVSVVLFIAIMLFAYDVRDKKYFKDVGSVAEEKETYNFFYGVFGYHSQTPIYSISNNDFDFTMYEIVSTKESDPNEMVEYVYMLYVPKTTEGKNNRDKYIRFYYEDNTYEMIKMYQYMDFNMYNTYDDNFLITKKYFGKKNFTEIAFVEKIEEEENVIYRDTYLNQDDNFVIKMRLHEYLEEHKTLPTTELISEGIYPRITHIAEGYTYVLWLGLGAALFVLLALFGGVYLKPPFQKGTVDPTPGMKKDKEKYL